MADPYWPYPFAPPPQSAEAVPAPQAPQTYYTPPVGPAAEPASAPDNVFCDHCGDEIVEGELCFIITQAVVKRSEKSGRLVPLEDVMNSGEAPPYFNLHEYCIHEFIMGEYVGDMYCANCDAKLNGE